jgi:radical SAM family uncharacterized protein/radical SAM-linked protein
MRELLPLFPRPSNYLGAEINAVHKDPSGVALRWGLAFPDLYEVAMAYPGQQILYRLLNADPRIWAERVFAPHPEVARILREHGAPLCTLESDTPLRRLDILGFSLTHELCYTTVLFMLDLAGIAFRSAERDESDPLIVAGGGAAYNPEPVAPFLDAVVLGEGEEAAAELSDAVLRSRQGSESRTRLLQRLSSLPGIYVPSLHPGGSRERAARAGQSGGTVRKRVIADLDEAPHPVSCVVPCGGAVHDRLNLEIARGCTRGCRFCQAGMTSRPVRERSLTALDRIMTEGLNSTGFEEVSFLSLSTGDYSRLNGLFRQSYRRCRNEQVAISLPSLRVGSLDPELMDMVSRIRRTGATLAPEAGSQRLRDVINKNVTETELLEHTGKLFEMGWHRVKLYFMIGLPTETETDLQAIADLCRKVQATAGNRKKLQITASVAPFVPKPHTPFQWCRQASREEILEKIGILRRAFRGRRHLKLSWHSPEMSLVEGVFARGGRDLAPVVEHAYRCGDILTGWQEYFDFGRWQRVFEEAGTDVAGALAQRPLDGSLPWDHLKSGVRKEFLQREYRRALQRTPTPDCRFGACQDCGVCSRLQSGSELAGDSSGRAIAPVLARDGEDGGAVRAGGEGEGPLSAPDAKAARMRLWFEKSGQARYLSQLELQSVLERAMRRAGLPLSFSRGFHPKPLLSFGRALPVGVASLSEWCIVYLREPVEAEPLARTLNRQPLPHGIRFLSAETLALDEPAPQARFEEYELHYLASRERARELQSQWLRALQRESLPVEHRSKKGVKTVDIRSFLAEAEPLSPDALRVGLDWSCGYLSPLRIVTGINPDMLPTEYELTKTLQVLGP